MNIRHWFTRSPRRHKGPCLKDVIAGVHLPPGLTPEQAAIRKQLGLKTVPTLKIESPFRAVTPPAPPTAPPDPVPSAPVPSREPWFSTFQLENQALRARINELENLLRWSRDREAALLSQINSTP